MLQLVTKVTYFMSDITHEMYLSKLHLVWSGECILVLRMTGSGVGLLYKQCRHLCM